jgi:hydroxymethylpyrimidine pyrophosphatase-like HAD family hydrolase
MSRTIRGILKTWFCERFCNKEPKIYIFDLDGTIIDSSHRATHDINGNIDLNGWKEKSTKDFIFQDSLLPLYAKLQEVYKNGDMVILCTARELGKWDYEYINMHNIYYDRIISRPKGNQTKDHILKKNQCRYLFTLPQYRNIEKWFFDDNWSNLEALAELGAVVSDARQWNKTA